MEFGEPKPAFPGLYSFTSVHPKCTLVPFEVKSVWFGLVWFSATHLKSQLCRDEGRRIKSSISFSATYRIEDQHGLTGLCLKG